MGDGKKKIQCIRGKVGEEKKNQCIRGKVGKGRRGIVVFTPKGKFGLLKGFGSWR